MFFPETFGYMDEDICVLPDIMLSTTGDEDEPRWPSKIKIVSQRHLITSPKLMMLTLTKERRFKVAHGSIRSRRLSISIL